MKLLAVRPNPREQKFNVGLPQLEENAFVVFMVHDPPVPARLQGKNDVQKHGRFTVKILGRRERPVEPRCES